MISNQAIELLGKNNYHDMHPDSLYFARCYVVGSSRYSGLLLRLDRVLDIASARSPGGHLSMEQLVPQNTLRNGH